MDATNRSFGSRRSLRQQARCRRPLTWVERPHNRLDGADWVRVPSVNLPSAGQSADQQSIVRADTLVLVDQVWARLQARLERGLGRVDRIVSSLFDRALEPNEVLEAIALCEHVAAKLGLLGLGASAELLRKAIVVLEQQDLGVATAIGLSSVLDDARISMANSVAELKLLSQTAEPLAIVGTVSEATDELIWVAAAQGLPVSQHIDGVIGDNHDVAGVIIVLDDENSARSKPLLRSIRETHPTQPLILLAPGTALEGRAVVAELVTLILPRDAHPIEVVTEIRKEITRSRQPRSISVFGVNAQVLAEPLWHRGLAARVETRLDDLIARLANGEARGVVLMPETGALDPEQVVRLIRTDPRTRAAVIIAVGESLDPARVHSALRDGVDDVFGPQVDADDLAVAIKARLQRRAELEPVVDPSEHRGTVPWPTATMMIERMLLVGFRRSTPVGIAIIRLHNPNITPGNAAGPTTTLQSLDAEADALDEAIAREFRGEDVISRLDGDHLVIALQGVSRRTLMGRLGDLQHEYGLAERQCRSIGLEFPIDGRSLGELLEEGRLALDRVVDEGGPWLAGADWRPWAAEASDVLLIDPDHALGVVIGEALSRRGITAHHEADALVALDELVGRTGKPLPRVVLMELDQRGIDGMAFLRQLRDAGTLHRTKVVVLSARSNESDLRMAFELGAVDFVGKPFSTPLLVHRLSRVLER